MATPAAVQGMLAALDDSDNVIVVRALALLDKEEIRKEPQVRKRLGSFIQEPRLAALLKDPDAHVRRDAARVLGAMGEAAREQAPRLVDLLKDPDAEVRRDAARALGAMGEGGRDQTLGLVDLLKDPDVRVRVEAARALGAMGEGAREQAPRLVDLLKDPDRYVRNAAAGALKTLGGAARDQAPRLGELLKDPDAHVRRDAARVLGAMGGVAGEQAPRLVDLLKDPDAHVRRDAAGALKAMGGAARDQAPRLVDLLKDPDAHVRRDAARVLGAMGEAAREQTPRLVDLLEDPDKYVRGEVARALGSMGEAAREQAPRLVDLLKDPDAHVRGAAAEALGAMGEAAREQAPRLVDLLKDPDAHARRAAAEALGAMGEVAREQAPRLGALLKDPDRYVRREAAGALKAMGKEAREQAPRLGDLLKDPDVEVRREAVRALGAMGEGAREQAPRLVDLLKDPDVEVRGAAAGALGAMGAAAREQAPHLGALLKDPDAHVRGEAAKALGAMGEAAWEQAPRLVSLLKDRDERVHQSAAEALGAMGEGARDQAPRLVSLLMEEDAAVRTRAAQALTGMAPIDSSHIAALLAVAGRDRGNRHEWLLRAHIAGGGVPQVERTLRWVLGRTSSEVPKALTLDEARETLRAFAELWPHTEKHTVLRDDLAQRIAHVANLASGQWTRADIELLASHEDNLKKPYPDHAAHLRTAIDSVERWKWLKWLLTLPLGLMLVVVAYVVFGVLFIFAYPYSLWIQAFFHNETWVIKGFGRVGFLLTWVPFLRRRLLAPFKHLLLAEAELDRFPEPYFQDSEVVLQSSGKREPLLTALQSLCGQVVLEGASGLGKSVFLKYLLRRSKSLAVFLRAESCTDGVLEAIQNKLEGYAKDPGFLKSIIYSGALDIYIDGLNEVTTKTRDSIVQFVQRYHKANILLATQRMEWRPPTTSRVYVLQPLSEVLISRFLGSSESLLGERARLRGKEYHEACTHFVQQALSSEHPEELRAATREILSNPMDLTVVAQMLAEGHSPDLFRLRQQQYGLMATDYMQNDPAGFPLEEFAEEAYTMRLEDRTSLPEDRFDKQLQHMQKAKMVVCRQWKGSDGQARRDWNFRHDKLQEFFIAQTFLGQGNPRIEEHMEDPRFRGVYFLLALVLEPEPARKLRDVLVLNAAKTRDHTVSDEFVTLLEARHKAEQARLSRPTAVAAPGA